MNHRVDIGNRQGTHGLSYVNASVGSCSQQLQSSLKSNNTLFVQRNSRKSAFQRVNSITRSKSTGLLQAMRRKSTFQKQKDLINYALLTVEHVKMHN